MKNKNLYFWIWLILLSALLITSLIICIFTYGEYGSLTSSIFGNVFAGFITGIMILLISNLKTCKKFKIKNKIQFLNDIKNYAKEAHDIFNELKYDEAISEEFSSLYSNISSVFIGSLEYSRKYNKKFKDVKLIFLKDTYEILDFLKEHESHLHFYKWEQSSENCFKQAKKYFEKTLRNVDIVINAIDSEIRELNYKENQYNESVF